MQNKKPKSLIVFLESDNFYECNILANNSLPNFMNNNILIGSKIKSFSINSCDNHNLLNHDINFVLNIIEYLINKYGIYLLNKNNSVNIFKESELNKLFNGIIPNYYKKLNVETGVIENYYIKLSNHITMIELLFKICKIYDIQFSIQIELQNYCYRRINILLDEI